MKILRVHIATQAIAVVFTMVLVAPDAPAIKPVPPHPWAESPIHRAIYDCSVAKVREELDKGANHNSLAAPSRLAGRPITPLGLALTLPRTRIQRTGCSRIEILRELLSRGATLYGGPYKDLDIPVEFATAGTVDELHLLLRAGMQIGRDLRTDGTMLGAATAAGNLELVLELLKLGVSSNATDSTGCSVVYRATQNYSANRYAMFEALLAAKADPNKPCKNDAPLHRLAAFPDPRQRDANRQIVDLLLRNGADPNLVLGSEGRTPLEMMMESSHADPDTAKLLVAAGARLTPKLGFLVAGASEYTGMPARWIDFLVEQGFDLNQISEHGGTALMVAVSRGHIQTAAAMLKRGANPNVRTKSGSSILHFLPTNDKSGPQALALLRPYGLDVNAKSNQQLTPLLALTHAQSQPSTIAMLIEFGADVRAIDNQGRGIVHRIAGNANVFETAPQTIEALRVVAANGANIDAADLDGNTPIMSAIRWRQPALVAEFIKLGANVNARNQYGLTPLHFAAYSGDTRTIRLLLENGVELNSVSALGERPRDLVLLGAAAGTTIGFVLEDSAGPRRQIVQHTFPSSALTAKQLEEALKLLSSGDEPSAQRQSEPQRDPAILHRRFNVR